ncbi:hypothetical protein GLOIN_2v1781395 [Rhizophagus clarus]|uniref:F-box domain-containing protein n=1 Tax=Rhizophagus clarus TaxID=94130 RepID=A0A8H3KQ37_9GLOM|nr:hypothetical protein GLOIN_2v1781395 [Rhizophagus clarus]
MTCSKLFSGDSPELIYEIIKYFQTDFSTLYSCILVNRLWCRLATPILWENPFSIPTRNYNFIEIYLHNSNDDLKTKLNEYKFINNSNTLFNYSKFLKHLNIYKFIFSVERWFGTAIRNLKPENRLSLLQDSDFKRLVHVSLFKIFIENEVNLHTLEIEIFTFHNYKSYYDDIIELILQNPNFIHDAKNLNFYVGSSPGFSYRNDGIECTAIKNRILQIINSHQNLQRILFSYDYFPLYHQSLLSSKYYNCSNSLNTIIFYNVNFRDMINLDKAFEQLNVLESVHIIYCYLNNNFIQQIINLAKPFKLKSLFIESIPQIKLLELLLQNSGDYLENFVAFRINYDSSLEQQLLELIPKYCKNIKFLGLYGFKNQVTYLISNLIENIKQNLNYLSIDVWDEDYGSIILQNLGQDLPSKLEYLSLSLKIEENDFKIFLENSQNIFVNKFLIMQKGNDDILHHIKEFIMKKKRVKYLAFATNNRDLSNLKDEVNEFKLHNIEVRNFSDLYLAIKSYDFIKKIDCL